MPDSDEPIRALVQLDQLERRLARLERENPVLEREVEARRHTARPNPVSALANPFLWLCAALQPLLLITNWGSPLVAVFYAAISLDLLITAMTHARYRARPGEALAIPGRDGPKIVLPDETGHTEIGLPIEAVSLGARPLVGVFKRAGRVLELRAMVEISEGPISLTRFVARFAGMPEARWQTMVTDHLLEAVEAEWSARPEASTEAVLQAVREASTKTFATLGLRLGTLTLVTVEEDHAHGVP